MDPRFATYLAAGGVQYKFANSANPVPSGPISPSEVIFNQGGTPGAPDVNKFISIIPMPTTNPQWGLGVSGPISGGIVDTVYSLGINPDGVPGVIRQTLNMEATFSPSPGVLQAEVYFEAEVPAGSDIARPIGYVQFTQGPDTGKVDTALQYVGKSFTLNGGPLGTIEQQWFVTDGQMLLVPNPYAITGNGALQVGATTGRLTTVAANGDWFMRATARSNISIDTIDFAKSNVTTTATLDQSTGEWNLLPAVDNTGQIGSNGLRFRLLRAVTITSGDIEMLDEERGAHWTLREMPDGILALNHITKKSYRLAMVEDSVSHADHQSEHEKRSMKLDEKTKVELSKAEEIRSPLRDHVDAMQLHIEKMARVHSDHLAWKKAVNFAIEQRRNGAS